MDPWSTSKCPMCRSSFNHFPAVSPILHHFLERAFPEEYAARAKETQEEEERQQMYSPQFPQAAQSPPGRTASWQPSDFACCNPGCQQLLAHPTVLNCGHVVCGPSCQPELGAACPTCGALAVAPPAQCKQLSELVQELFPEEWRQRCHMPASSTAQPVAGSPVSPTEQRRPQQPSGVAAGGAAPEAEQAAQQSASLGQAEAASGEAPGEAGDVVSLLRRVRSVASQRFVHTGVGCDACGQYPVVGRRYRCEDCPERIGFDLCGACYDRSLHRSGRFNQRHTADHKMSLVEPRPSFLHVLQAAHPELSMAQIRSLLQLAFEEADDPPIPHVHRSGPRPAGPVGPAQETDRAHPPGLAGPAASPEHGSSDASAVPEDGSTADSEEDFEEQLLLAYMQHAVPP